MKRKLGRTGRLTLICAAVALVAQAGFAGDRIGNGGDCLKTANGLRLLDLVEAGVADGSTVDFSNPDKMLVDRVQAIFGNALTSSDQHVLVSYLSTLPQGQAYALLAGMEMYSWHWVDDSFVDVPDVDSTIKYDPKDLIQTAVRSGFAIQIRQDIWNRLDSRNRAALLMHEVLYAFVVPAKVQDATSGKTYYSQSSQTARQAIGDIFSNGAVDLNRYAINGQPVFGAAVPQRTTNVPVQFDGFSQSLGSAFKYSPVITVVEQYLIDAGKPWGWSNYGSSGNWAQLKFSADDNWGIAEYCNEKNRTMIENAGEAGTLKVDNTSGTLPKKSGEADLIVSGSIGVFRASFASYDGIDSPMVYLKATTETITVSPSIPKITSKVSESDCESALKESLKEVAYQIVGQ